MIIGSERIHFRELPSTNSFALQLLKEKEPAEGTVIHADFQTAGKGQKGNTWQSEEGKNLLFSIILYPETVSPEDQFFISMTISLGICDFIEEDSALAARIKWPNDIYVNNDKIAGILIENSLIGNQIENCIAGIGLNINQEKFPDNIRNAASLRSLTGVSYDREICLKHLLQKLDERYKVLLYGDRMMLRKEYISKLYRLKEWHLYKTSEGLIRGKISDISFSGRLQIETEEGKIKDFGFREVEFTS
jgi:BirA family biotin operon repressor/biotin-[acetyl-CoA-carboxylase] ligase